MSTLGESDAEYLRTEREDRERTEIMRRTGYTVRVRMNDYVGPGIYAAVTWASGCPRSESGAHLLGLLGHTCAHCGAAPTEIVYGQ